MSREEKIELLTITIMKSNLDNNTKKQLLEYIQELYECWNERYIDMSSKQNINIIEDEKDKRPKK